MAARDQRLAPSALLPAKLRREPPIRLDVLMSKEHFRMLAGLENARSAAHLAEVFVLLDGAGLLRDPELAADRASRVLGEGSPKPAPRQSTPG